MCYLGVTGAHYEGFRHGHARSRVKQNGSLLTYWILGLFSRFTNKKSGQKYAVLATFAITPDKAVCEKQKAPTTCGGPCEKMPRGIC